MDTEVVKELKVIKDKMSELNDSLKDLNAAKINLETQIIESMQVEGISLARTDFGTVSVTKTDVASVKDWPAFEEYIYENRALHLLQRRTSAPAYRDQVAAEGEIPGVVTFTKHALSLTNKTT